MSNQGRLPGLSAGVGVVALWLFVGVAPVLADAGPHVATVNSGSAGINADSCAGCHRAHTALGPNLILAPDETALCLTCHGPAAAGATTDVIDGVLAATTQGLKGGGFEFAIMDTTWTGGAVSRPATSAHTHDGSPPGTIWGNGAVGSGPGTTGMPLTCITCHNPHGNESYRILRPIPAGSGATTDRDVTDEAIKVYTVASAENRYFGEVYFADFGFNAWVEQYKLDEWCVQCHTRYEGLEDGTGHTDSGDPIFKYRHMTRWPTGWINCDICHPGPSGSINAADPLGVGASIAHESVCQNCHVAHGSSALMGTYSGTVAWPDDSTTPSGDERSSLLRLDNRGVCVACHAGTAGR